MGQKSRPTKELVEQVAKAIRRVTRRNRGLPNPPTSMPTR